MAWLTSFYKNNSKEKNWFIKGEREPIATVQLSHSDACGLTKIMKDCRTSKFKVFSV